MSYSPAHQVGLLHSGTWVDLNDFRALLHTLTSVSGSFSIKAERQRALQAIINVPSNPRFALDRRFGEFSISINMHHPYMAERFSTMVAALDIETRSTEVHGDKSGVQRVSVNDAKQAFVNSLKAVNAVINNANGFNTAKGECQGLFTRDTFEGNYNLVWTDAAAPAPARPAAS